MSKDLEVGTSETLGRFKLLRSKLIWKSQRISLFMRGVLFFMEVFKRCVDMVHQDMVWQAWRCWVDGWT